MLTLAIATGMRKGEIGALKWEDIDFDGQSLQIRRSMGRIAGHGVITKEPKTAKGRRKIILPQFAVDALKLPMAYQLEQKEKVGSSWEEKGFVFPNTYGRFLSPQTIHRLFKKLLADAGFPHMRFHDLRPSTTLLVSVVQWKHEQDPSAESLTPTLTRTGDFPGALCPAVPPTHEPRQHGALGDRIAQRSAP
jgi:integrase